MALSNPIHIAFLAVVLLLVFGAKRLPELGSSLGSGMRGFRDSISGHADDADGTAAVALPALTEQHVQPQAPQGQPAQHAPVPQPVAQHAGGVAPETAVPHLDVAA